MTYVAINNNEAGLSTRNKINGIGTGLDAHTGASGSDVHNLGTISNQSASAVNITGGTVALSTIVAHTSLSGSDAHGLGTISVQSASAVNITGGTITPFTTHTNLSGSDVHNLGTISNQSASSIALTGGTIAGATISNIYNPITSTAINLTLNTTHYAVMASGSPTVFLPTAVGISGRVYHVKNTGSGTITVQASGSQLIDEANNKLISSIYSSMQIISDGTNWNII
jgi:hypothetical protein